MLSKTILVKELSTSLQAWIDSSKIDPLGHKSSIHPAPDHLRMHLELCFDRYIAPMEGCSKVDYPLLPLSAGVLEATS